MKVKKVPFKIKRNRLVGDILIYLESFFKKRILKNKQSKFWNYVKDLAEYNQNQNWGKRISFIEYYYGEQHLSSVKLRKDKDNYVKNWQIYEFEQTGKFKQYYKYKLL